MTKHLPYPKILVFLLTALVAGLPLQAQNVMISMWPNPNEPSIMMHPKKPNILVAGAILDQYYLSMDTGRTWTARTLKSSHGVWGDPVIVADTLGHFYYFHLSNPPAGTNPAGGGNLIDRIVCQKSTDDGQTWTDGTYTGLNGTKAQDKHWAVVDPRNNHIYLTWTQFDKYGSADLNDRSNIMFSKSTDQGESWSSPQKINAIPGDCLDGDNTVMGAVPAVGPNGEIYVSWASSNGVVFSKSLDGGQTWLAEEKQVASMPGGWKFSIPGIYRCNGLPVTTCDLSNGPNRGTIYVNWSDQRNGRTDTDIFLVKSTDAGQTWTEPVRVNNDKSGKHQFFTWMAIDQATGYLYFIFYDRRDFVSDNTDVYMALSTDGGQTFINRKISGASFLPNANVFFGDYTNLTVHDGIIRPIWTRLDESRLSVWTHLMRVEDFFTTVPTDTSTRFKNYPNPATTDEFVSFKVPRRAWVNLSLYDVNGKRVAAIIQNEMREPGRYIEKVSLRDLRIAAGMYYLRLEIDGEIKVNRMVKH